MGIYRRKQSLISNHQRRHRPVKILYYIHYTLTPAFFYCLSVIIFQHPPPLTPPPPHTLTAIHGLLYNTAPHIAETGQIKPASFKDTLKVHVSIFHDFPHCPQKVKGSKAQFFIFLIRNKLIHLVKVVAFS